MLSVQCVYKLLEEFNNVKSGDEWKCETRAQFNNACINCKHKNLLSTESIMVPHYFFALLSKEFCQAVFSELGPGMTIWNFNFFFMKLIHFTPLNIFICNQSQMESKRTVCRPAPHPHRVKKKHRQYSTNHVTNHMTRWLHKVVSSCRSHLTVCVCIIMLASRKIVQLGIEDRSFDTAFLINCVCRVDSEVGIEGGQNCFGLR